MNLSRKLLAIVFAIIVIAIAATAFVYLTIPSHNTDLTHFDAIIVLGTPSKLDGTASPEQRERTLVIEEGQAQNTIQNIFYSQRIMAAHNWTSAEVVSSPSHLPRTDLILQHYTFGWRTHSGLWPSEYSFWQRAAHFCVEAEYCIKLKIFGFPPTPFLPRPA